MICRCMTWHDWKTIAFTCMTLNFHITVLFGQTCRAGMSTIELGDMESTGVCRCVGGLK
jgi:hypothetical protein